MTDIISRINNLKGRLQDYPNMVSRLTSIATYKDYFDPEILTKFKEFEEMFTGFYSKAYKKESSWLGKDIYTTKTLQSFYNDFISDPKIGERLSSDEFKELSTEILKQLKGNSEFIKGTSNSIAKEKFTEAVEKYNTTRTKIEFKPAFRLSFETKDWEKWEKLDAVFKNLQKKYLLFNQTIDPYKNKILGEFRSEFDKIKKDQTYNEIKTTFDSLRKKNDERIAHYKKVSKQPDTGKSKEILQEMNNTINNAEKEKYDLQKLHKVETEVKEKTQLELQELNTQKEMLSKLAKDQKEERTKLLKDAENIYNKTIQTEKSRIETDLSLTKGLDPVEISIKIAEEQRTMEDKLKRDFDIKAKEKLNQLSQKYDKETNIILENIKTKEEIIKENEKKMRETEKETKEKEQKIVDSISNTEKTLYNDPSYAQAQLNTIKTNLSWFQKLLQNKTLLIILVVILIIGTIVVVATWLFFVGIALLLNLAYQKSYQRPMTAMPAVSRSSLIAVARIIVLGSSEEMR